MTGDTRQKLMALAAVAIVVAAVAWTLVPFHDGYVRCDDAVTTAVNGEPAVLNSAGGPIMVGSEAKGVESGDVLGGRVIVACRAQARLRVGLSVVVIAATIIGPSQIRRVTSARRSGAQRNRRRKDGSPRLQTMWGKLLTASGFVVTVAGIVFGVWLEFALPGDGLREDTYFRLTVAIEALIPIGVGLLIVTAGRILVTIEGRATTSEPDAVEIAELLE